MAAAARARALRAEGRDIISLTLGEPDFPTPPHAIEAAHEAALRGFLAGEQRHSVTPRSPANPVLDTLTSERRRLAAELDEQNGLRTSLHAQLATLDQRIVAAGHAAAAVKTQAVVVVPVLVADRARLIILPDPRLVSVPSILLVGLVGALLLQWAMLRGREVIATAAEAEVVLGLPVLRCLDVDGHVVSRDSGSGLPLFPSGMYFFRGRR